MLRGSKPGAAPATSSCAQRWPPHPGGGLSAYYSQPALQADGAAASCLPRRAVPTAGLPCRLGTSARRVRCTGRLPNHGGAAGARSRTWLRSRPCRRVVPAIARGRYARPGNIARPVRPEHRLPARRCGEPAVDCQLRRAAARNGGDSRGSDTMSDSITIDTARLPLLLGELRLPTIGKLWQSFTARADREGWPSARLLATLAELELAERAQRRTQRLRGGMRLFGPSGSGKSHLGAALGHALVENGYRVLFTRTTDLVQRLQTARQSLSLESAIEKLDKYHLIILDNLCTVNRDQAETSALFELIASRYERRSLLVTSNRPFGEWTTVFPDAAMTLAAVDRLVHHAVILEMNVQSCRQRSAATRHKQRPPSDSKGDTKQKEIITA